MTVAHERRPRYFFRAAAATFLVVMGVAIIAPVLPALSQQLGLSRFETGMLLSSFAAGRVMFSIPGGALFNRLGFRMAGVLGCVITATGAIVAAGASRFDVLLIAQLTQGAGSAVFNTGAMAWMVSVIPPTGAGRLISEYQGAVLLGISFAPVVGGLSTSLFGLRGPFLVYAASAALAGIGTAMMRGLGPRPSRVSVTERAKPRLSGLAANRTFVLAMVACLLYFWTLGGVRNTLVPLFADDELGVSAVRIGFLLTISGLAHVALMRTAGRTIDTVGRRPVITWSVVALALVVATFGATNSFWALVPAMVAFGLVQGFAGVAPIAVLVDVVPEQTRGLAVGVQRTVSALGLMLGPAMLGGMADVMGYRATFAVSTALLLLGAALVGRIPETFSADAAAQPL